MFCNTNNHQVHGQPSPPLVLGNVVQKCLAYDMNLLVKKWSIKAKLKLLQFVTVSKCKEKLQKTRTLLDFLHDTLPDSVHDNRNCSHYSWSEYWHISFCSFLDFRCLYEGKNIKIMLQKMANNYMYIYHNLLHLLVGIYFNLQRNEVSRKIQSFVCHKQLYKIILVMARFVCFLVVLQSCQHFKFFLWKCQGILQVNYFMFRKEKNDFIVQFNMYL